MVVGKRLVERSGGGMVPIVFVERAYRRHELSLRPFDPRGQRVGSSFGGLCVMTTHGNAETLEIGKENVRSLVIVTYIVFTARQGN